MKVTVKKYLNVRVGAPSVNAPCYQYLAPGSELEVDGVLYEGDLFEDSDKWLKDAANNYYWAGGVESNNELNSLLVPKINPDWFTQLKIEQIWQKYKIRGEGVTVAVLDTGIDLSNKEFADTLNSDNYWVGVNYPGTPQCNTIKDLNGHGTRCASLIGARNLYDYNIGIAPACKLLYCKISCDGEKPSAQSILDAIKWAIAKGAEIINISYYFLFDSVKEKQAFEQNLTEILKEKEVFLFACAGNNADPNNAYSEDYYPASFPAFISVGATNGNTFSNITVQNNNTIIHAPGINILSYSLTKSPDKASGTSFSTPIIAGIIALLISKYKHNKKEWVVSEIKKALVLTGDSILNNRKIINPTNLFKYFFL